MRLIPLLLLFLACPAQSSAGDAERRIILENFLAMGDPILASQKLEDAIIVAPRMDMDIKGWFATDPDSLALPNRKKIQAVGVEEGLQKYVEANTSGIFEPGSKVCILQFEEADTPREFYTNVSEVLSMGLSLWRMPLAMWTIYCAPTAGHVEQLQEMSAIRSISEFRAEYKLYRIPSGKSSVERLHVKGMWPIGELERESISSLGYTLEWVSDRTCVVTGDHVVPHSVAALWWVYRVKVDETKIVPE